MVVNPIAHRVLGSVRDVSQRVERRWTIAIIAAIAIAGVVVRALVVRSARGVLNADEAYTGIEAYEVLAGRFPVVLGGTSYTAVFEAYLYAPIAAVIGGNAVALKMIAMAFWALAAVLIGIAARDLVATTSTTIHDPAPRRAGLIAGAIAWITPGALLSLSTQAYASYASGLAVLAATFVVARRMVDDPRPGGAPALAVGALAGLGLWMHPMYLAVLIPIVAYVLALHRRWRLWATVVVGGLIGAGPFLLWNALNGFASRRLPVEVEGTWLERLSVFGRELLPRAWGLRDQQMDWYLPVAVAVGVYGALIAATVAGAVIVGRRSGRHSRWLLAATLAGVLPIMAMFPPLIYSADGRYGIISFAFITIAIAVTADRLITIARRVAPAGASRAGATIATTALAIVLLAIAAAVVIPDNREIFSTGDAAPNTAAIQTAALIRDRRITHIAGSYWRVLPVEFFGDDELYGSTLISPRFPERRAAVLQAAPETVAWVFEPTEENPALLPLPVDAYERVVIGDIVTYLPQP